MQKTTFSSKSCGGPLWSLLALALALALILALTYEAGSWESMGGKKTKFWEENHRVSLALVLAAPNCMIFAAVQGLTFLL